MLVQFKNNIYPENGHFRLNSGLSITEYFRNYIFDCFTRKPSDSEKKKTAAVTLMEQQQTRRGGATRPYLEMVELRAGKEAFAGTRAGVTWSAGLQTHSYTGWLVHQHQREASLTVGEILLWAELRPTLQSPRTC